MGLPKNKRIGEEWKKDSSELFCQIGDPTKLQVLMPVSPDDHDLLRGSIANAKKHNWKLPIVIRIQGRDMHTWEGDITELPQAVAKEVPNALTTKYGGPLAPKTGAGEDPLRKKNQDQFVEGKENEGRANNPDMAVPQNQVYLVHVNILNSDNAIAPGSLAQVKIYCEYRSGAWWAWRAINKTFDLGLM